MVAVTSALPFTLAAMVVFVLMVAALPSPLGRIKTEVGGVVYANTIIDAWYRCTRPTGGSEASCLSTVDKESSCGKTRSLFQVTQAFYVMGSLWSLLAVLLGGTVFGGKLPFGKANLVLGAAGALVTLGTLLAFISAILTQTVTPCEGEALQKRDGHSWGPSAFFALGAFLASVVLTGLGFLYSAPADEKEQNNKASPPTAPI